ncbi:single-stranded DNA-binding protein [Lactococcus allomyrinae]|uniref:Single-stranded DNA-binding protein n=1 Tax=Lactococcus allomyrinae TaxID=2419773 RepID=A0A387BGA6_9LACT|nr:single-stranded DNA-binding protein [Lactococcus allomyrinae]AYF99879.1 single-stranded DNA-binding protein [Lactococcus allomyrinae]
MTNTVVLVGRLTREIELHYTPQNQAVATFSLAVNRPFKNANGEREADFIHCVIWRKQAENLANWTRKGTQIAVTGHIQTRSYENSSGDRVYVTEVVVDNFQMLETRAIRENKAAEQISQQVEMISGSDNVGEKYNPFENREPMNIPDEALPF